MSAQPTQTRESAIEDYRAARSILLAADAAADAAFLRHFTKLQAGEPTNGAQTSRLSTLANYAGADLASAQLALYRFDLDPADVDRDDGVTRVINY